MLIQMAIFGIGDGERMGEEASIIVLPHMILLICLEENLFQILLQAIIIPLQ